MTTRSILLSLLLAAATLTSATVGAPARAADCARASAADFDGDGSDDIAAGDPFADGGKGAVHLLTGGKVVTLPAQGLADGDGYGWSVKLTKVNGDGCADLVVGAPYSDVNGVRDAGAVHILYGGAAQPTRVLNAPQPQQDAHFGWSLAASGNLLAIGAPHEDEARIADAGSVYIRAGESPLRRISQDSVDIPGNGEVGDQFGFSLAMSRGRSLFVGVPYENDDGAGRQVGTGKVHSGQVTVVRDVTARTLQGVKWDSPTRTAGDRYGYAVAYADGQGLAVSAPGPGYVQLYNADLRPIRMVKQNQQAFGFSLAVAADGRVAIGSPYAGGVRVVSLRDQAENRQLSGEGLFGWSVAFSANRLYVGQPDTARGGRVAVAGRNSDDVQELAPAKGADFGASLTG